MLLLFSRLVSNYLFNCISTFNIPPSMLSAFRDFNAMKSAKDSNVTYQGATLHNVDGSIDKGKVNAQKVYPIDKK